MINYSFLSNTALFRGTTAEEIEAMLHCLGAKTKIYEKGEIILHSGQTVDHFGLVLSGGVIIENNDLWGNRSVLGHIEPGHIFAETYACIPGETLLVSAVAIQKTEVLFLNAARLLQTCSNTCAHHSALIQNLLQISSQKNLQLSHRIFYTSSKSIRGRLMSFFSDQVKQSGSYTVTIPFNRQQLADYLSVDRSAMSNELSKMKRDGILTYERNTFQLNQEI